LLIGGPQRADLSMVAVNAAEERVTSGPNGFSLEPRSVGTYQAVGVAGTGWLVQGTNGGPVMVAARLDGPHGGSDTMAGAAGTAARWLVMPSTPPSGGQGFLVLANPGAEPARISLEAISASGAGPGAASSPTEVGAGKVVVIPLRSLGGTGPVSVLVTASGSTVVAGSVSTLADGTGFAATLGLIVSTGS